MQRVLNIFAVAGIVGTYLSPNIGGMLLRASTAVWLAWGGIISSEQYMTFSANFHF